MTGYVSPFASALRFKQRESDEIARQVAEFEAAGGKIQYFSQGDKSEPAEDPRRNRQQRKYTTKRSPA